jgi:hypothetical protein
MPLDSPPARSFSLTRDIPKPIISLPSADKK